VGEIPYPYEFKLSDFEIDKIIEVPVSALRQKQRASGMELNYRGEPVQSWVYEYDGNVIWGVTARIVHHFLELIFGEIEKECNA
jgi:hypothetical protein